MSSSDSEGCGVVFVVFAVMALSYAFGFAVGKGNTNGRWHQELIKQKLYHYTINPETGEENFCPINKENE